MLVAAQSQSHRPDEICGQENYRDSFLVVRIGRVRIGMKLGGGASYESLGGADRQRSGTEARAEEPKRTREVEKNT